jgi:hypothetical protein
MHYLRIVTFGREILTRKTTLCVACGKSIVCDVVAAGKMFT